MTAPRLETTPDIVQRQDAPPRWSRLLAAAVIAQPLLLAVNGAFHPDVEMEAASLLAGASEGANSWYAVHLVAAMGALLTAPAAFGMRRLLRVRHRIANAGVAAALVTAVVLPLAFMAEASVLRLAVTAGIGESAALALADEYLQSPEFYAVGLGVLTAGLAGVLFGIGLLLERRVPRWMPIATLVGTVISMGAPPGSVTAPLAFGIVAAAAVGLARRIAAPPRRPHPSLERDLQST